jgi:hypothetical protein
MANIANQFTGLPIEQLISAPLVAAAEGQKSLAATTAAFIQEVGMDKDGNTKSVAFKYADGSEFEMEVSTQSASKSSTDSSAELNVKAGWGCWSASFTGKVSHHSENSRSSDTSAKYSVSVKGKQEKPEGLMKVLDMLNNSIGKEKGAASSDGSGS